MKKLMLVFLFVFSGCSTPPDVLEGQKSAQISLSKYVEDVDKQVLEALNSYEQAVREHADYRYDIIIRSLKGANAADDVRIATEAYTEKERLYKEAAAEKTKITLNINKLKINLYDHDMLQGRLTEWLTASGISAESAVALTAMIATEFAKRRGK